MVSKASVLNSSGEGKAPKQEAIIAQVNGLIAWAMGNVGDLRGFERELFSRLFGLGRMLVALFIESRRSQVERGLNGPRWSVVRAIATVFGEVNYERTYVRGDQGHGEAPLDRALGITADLVSANLLCLSALLSTQMPYAHVRDILSLFVGYVPSAKTIQHAILGLGGLANTWLENAPIAEGDGQVLVMLFDSKGVPTATEDELLKRRGKRRPCDKSPSPRHRGRERRAHWKAKQRRKSGDKSKNARLCTVVVIYTLERKDALLLGPLNKQTYVSFGPKEIAFQWARRHATRRGFGPSTTQTIQIVTDGDDDLATYVRRYFPNATHTLDIYHALEYVWEAGVCVHGDGSPAQESWYRRARKEVFEGRSGALLKELEAAHKGISRTGPGNKSRRERLEKALNYLRERLPMMRYKWLTNLDLELGSGAVEGTIRHLVGQRCDHGGMRWIRERVQPLLQLRCIHHNGHWDEFVDWALPQLSHPTDERPVPRIQRTTPTPLPQLAKAV